MEIDKKAKLRLALTGAAAGIINGFFGGGGGIVLLPMLRSLCGLEDRRAFATSVAVMLPLCAVSALVYCLRSGAGIWSSAAPFLLGGVIGGVLSGLFFKKLPPKLLVRAFALLIILGGLRSVIRL